MGSPVDLFRSSSVGVPVLNERSSGRIDGLDFTGKDIEWFRGEAARRSIRLDPELQIVLRRLEPIARWADTGGSRLRMDPRLLIDVAATASLLRTIRRVQQTSSVLAAAMWSRVSAHGRMVLPMKSTDRGNKLWEVVVAGAMSAHFDDVRLAEPDVTSLFGGQAWGCACKVLHSPRKDTQLARIIDGMDQIESSESGSRCPQASFRTPFNCTLARSLNVSVTLS